MQIISAIWIEADCIVNWKSCIVSDWKNTPTALPSYVCYGCKIIMIRSGNSERSKLMGGRSTEVILVVRYPNLKGYHALSLYSGMTCL